MIFKYLYTQQGGHYHTRVFSAKSPDHTFAKLGELTLDEDDMEALRTGEFVNLLQESK